MVLIPENELAAMCREYGIEITHEEYALYERYISMVLEKNKVMNLTRITEPYDVSVKHILDSLIPFVYSPPFGRTADVGTGAGFPGAVMKIHDPSLDVTLIDSLRKRIDFLCEVSEATLPMECVHIRAEDAGRGELREHFDTVAARAVAALPVLCEYCLPLTKPGGKFIALKTPSEDAGECEALISELGGRLSLQKDYTLPDGEKRRLIVIEKVTSTPSRYPRKKIR